MRRVTALAGAAAIMALARYFWYPAEIDHDTKTSIEVEGSTITIVLRKSRLPFAQKHCYEAEFTPAILLEHQLPALQEQLKDLGIDLHVDQKRDLSDEGVESFMIIVPSDYELMKLQANVRSAISHANTA